MTYHNAVVPGEGDEFVKLVDKVPARSNVSCNEYPKRERGEGVHAVLGRSDVQMERGGSDRAIIHSAVGRSA